jgi:hypothetical protein
VSSLKNVSVDDQDEGLGKLAELKLLGQPDGVSMKLIYPRRVSAAAKLIRSCDWFRSDR